VGARDLLDGLRAAVAALGGAGEAVVVAAADDLGLLALNRAASELLGGVAAEGRPLDWMFPDLLPGELRDRVDALMRAGGRSMGLTTRPRWEPPGGRRVAVRVDLVRREGVPLVLAFVRDSPEERALRPTAAPPSPLAALPDRAALLAELDAEIRRAFRHRRGLGLVSVRVRGPQGTSDPDQETLLDDAARRLREAVRAEETLGRTGRDSFAWVLHEADAAGTRAAAERARRAASGGRPTGVLVRVGLAALARGDSAAELLRRAERDAVSDPGPGRRGGRSSGRLDPVADMVLRAALAGDARALGQAVHACIDDRGHLDAYDEVLHPVVARLTRVAGPDPVRPAEQHRAVVLLEWALARRPRAYAPPDAPVLVVLPLGSDARRVTLHAVMDAGALAGWGGLAVEVPPAADVTRPVLALGAEAVAVVLGDDSDLLEAARIVDGLAELDRGLTLLVAGAPGGIMRRWNAPPPARAVTSASAMATVLGGPPVSAAG
jgi:GGDEF domain-containing protein